MSDRYKNLIKQLVKRLAIPLGNQKTVTKWLLIANWPTQQKALHSHSAKPPAEELLAGHPKDGDLSRWLTLGKSLVICFENSRKIHFLIKLFS